jgi:hypothetical protein
MRFVHRRVARRIGVPQSSGHVFRSRDWEIYQIRRCILKDWVNNPSSSWHQSARLITMQLLMAESDRRVLVVRQFSEPRFCPCAKPRRSSAPRQWLALGPGDGRDRSPRRPRILLPGARGQGCFILRKHLAWVGFILGGPFISRLVSIIGNGSVR